MTAAQNVSAAAPIPIAENTGSGPRTVATAPSTGPSMIPKIATASTDPIICPRRSRGAEAMIQVNPPVQAKAPPTPSANRARSSRTTFSANAKTTLETAISASPVIIALRTPARAAKKPAGIEASSVPAA